jgi:hypothetical protein
MRTFIFGAGASCHAGYPLASDMWRALERWVHGPPSPEISFVTALQEINARFDFSRSFELALSDFDDRIEQLSKPESISSRDLKEKLSLQGLRHTLTCIILRYFDSLRSHPAEVYETFAKNVLTPGDAMITFNYDIALESALMRSGKWSVGNGYGFTIDVGSFGTSACKFLKLHGSTNWRGQLFQNRPGAGGVSLQNLSLGKRPVIPNREMEYLGYANISDPEACNGGRGVECLIWPTAKKRFFTPTSYGREWEGFWNLLWSQASGALNASEEVVLIGYSAPEYDSRARRLLATLAHSRASIKVCCHTATTSVVESLQKLGLTHAQATRATRFEDWLLAKGGE